MTAILDDIRRKLGTARDLWDDAELEQYIQEGENEFTFATSCLWDMDVLPDYAFAFNYTSTFEKAYFLAGDRIAGEAQFTALFERDYIDNAQGPANHTQHWEFNDGFLG